MSELRQLWKGQAKDQKSGTLLDCIDKMRRVYSYEEREKRDVRASRIGFYLVKVSPAMKAQIRS